MSVQCAACPLKPEFHTRFSLALRTTIRNDNFEKPVIVNLDPSRWRYRYREKEGSRIIAAFYFHKVAIIFGKQNFITFLSPPGGSTGCPITKIARPDHLFWIFFSLLPTCNFVPTLISTVRVVVQTKTKRVRSFKSIHILASFTNPFKSHPSFSYSRIPKKKWSFDIDHRTHQMIRIS